MNATAPQSSSTPARGAAVRFEHVQKSYDGVVLVVKDLNLDIAPGEFVTMLGPSGSGKTTCLMMLAGFEPATHGEIFINDKPINKVPPAKRGIGMVFQNYALFPHMSVAENLSYPLEIRNMDKAERETKVKRALDMVELGAFGNRRPAQLSGGQQQRVAVARALVFDPDLVLMDEPLGALDKQLREQMQYEIKHIHESLGVSVVYVTHDQTEALTMSDRVAVFEAGVIQQLSSPSDLYERPQNSFVAQFIGENNKLTGVLSSRDGDRCKLNLDNGTELLSEAVNVGDVGTRSTISLRPERVELEPAGHKDNLLDGVVREVLYLGDHLRIVMSVAGNDEFIVKVPNGTQAVVPVEGHTYRLGWNAADARALDPVN